MSGCTYTLLWPMKANCDLMSSSAPIRLPIQMLEESPLVSFFRIGGHLDNSNGQLAFEFCHNQCDVPGGTGDVVAFKVRWISDQSVQNVSIHMCWPSFAP